MTRALSDDSSGATNLEVEPSAIVAGDDGRRIAYTEYGDPDGAPLVILHGTPGSRVLGWLFDDCARAVGVRVLTPDRPGYGRSTPWPDRELTDTASIVAAVLEDADVSRAGLVGFSGGGPHALAVAAARGDLVESIDIVSGPPPRSVTSDLPTVQRFLGILAAKAPLLLKGLLRCQTWVAGRASPTLVLSQYTTARERGEIPPAVAHCARRDFVEAFATHRDGFVTESRLFARDWEFSIEDVAHPVRLWHGDTDANVPLRGVRGIRERLPNCELTVLEDAGHLSTLLRSRSRIVRYHRNSAPG